MRTYGTATLKGDTWFIDAVPHVAMKMKRLFKRSDRGTPGRIKFTHGLEMAADLEWFCQRYPLEIKPDSAILHEAADAYRERILRLEEYIDVNYQPRAFDMALAPRSYQAREAEIAFANGSLLVADEVGLGKTVAALALLSHPETLPAVIVVPTHLPRQWAAECQKFLPRARVHIVKKGTPYPLVKDSLFGGPDILIINYAKLAGWATVLAQNTKTVIFDEIQALRRKDGKRGEPTAKYASAQMIAGAASFRLGLSATPIYNYGGEIFNVFEILQPGLLGSWREFTTEWCVPLYNGQYRIKDARSFGTWARDAFAMIRHTRKEVGRELPDVLKVVQKVDANTSALDAIEDRAGQLARILLGETEEQRGDKMNSAEQLSNLLRQATGIAKAPYVAEFVRILVESGEQVVLCGWHRAVYEIWESKLKDLGVAYFTGSETPAQKDEAKRRFVARQAKVLFLSLRSGEGLNDLQKVSSCIVFGELDWSPGVLEQCIGRLNRDGQSNVVVAYYLVTDEGADPDMVSVLGLKKEQVDGIRDPQGAIVERVETTGDHIKRLAARYLEKKGKAA